MVEFKRSGLPTLWQNSSSANSILFIAHLFAQSFRRKSVLVHIHSASMHCISMVIWWRMRPNPENQCCYDVQRPSLLYTDTVSYVKLNCLHLPHQKCKQKPYNFTLCTYSNHAHMYIFTICFWCNFIHKLLSKYVIHVQNCTVCIFDSPLIFT